ncbi:NAD(+)/NADH kinase [Halanaeroarchaeum sulfurireducens]|uniref:ATP-NAD/AcoX kinase n=1 Tax=Halanaeroarchaeum sulfurireducens TaxID=1604004 RepID=A0A0N9MHP9_9EURY|nr:NAD(+)/NADH kinase [Halanaeroarchaeum sulfurireducens]ALG81722.1 ATP-NAD/AcoX kinase [Halanaeroarchaeum sulfurireducens]
MTSENRADPQSEIGVVGEDEAAIADRVRAAGASAAVVEPAGAAEVDTTIAVGKEALISLVREGVTGPVLPVGVDGSVPGVQESRLDGAIESLLNEDVGTTDQPLLRASVGTDHYVALMDIMTVTEEPAKISEFTIEPRVRDRARTVDRVRADGVVVATAAGTPGYATAAGGPVIDPASSAVSVVPVGPFRIEQTHWTLELPVTLTVAREGAAVSLLVDDAEVAPVPTDEPVELTWGEPLTLVLTEQSRSSFAGEQ